MPDLNPADWFGRFRDALDARTLEGVTAQLVLILVLVAAALLFRRLTRGWTDRAYGRAETAWPFLQRAAGLRGAILPLYLWGLLFLANRATARLDLPIRLIGAAASLVALWAVLRVTGNVLRDALIARFVALVACTIAALDVVDLLAPTATALDSLAITLGTYRLSALLVVKAALTVLVLLWAAYSLARFLDSRIRQTAGLSPSLKVLIGNLLKTGLLAAAFLLSLNIVGIDLTAFAVFGGAIGVGIGLGLQKIVSNFISGIVLLLDRSIKPGDVIEVERTFGWITSLGARHVSVLGRDGKYYLIPNEDLVTHRVTNWSYKNSLIRIDAPFSIAYGSDVRAVRRLAVDAAAKPSRSLKNPAPVCHVTELGENGIALLLRFWIDDPANGVTNIRGEVLLALWEAMSESGIEVPPARRRVEIVTRAAEPG